jgi:predicted enzyme related to lactoylglutathione lyase
MSINNALAGIPVRDISAAIIWYEKLLGRRPDSRPMASVAEWRFPSGGWIQLFQAPARAGTSSVTLAVSNLDEAAVDLKRKGIALGEPADSPMVKIASAKDPDGNQIVFAEARLSELAQ